MAFSIRLVRVDGAPVHAGDLVVTPQAHVLSVQLPRAGFVWQLPTSVLVERSGHRQRVPILDVTRLALVGLFVLAVRP